MSPMINRIFCAYVRAENLSARDYVFRYQKGGRPFTLVSLSRLVSNRIKAHLSDSTRFVIELFNLHKKLLEHP